MAQRQSNGTYDGPLDIAAVATLVERVGLALVALALPVAVGAFAGIALNAGSLLAGIDAAVAALNGPLTAGRGLSWLFHVSTLATAVGCWFLGLGLLLDGLDL
ncbi:hypothetical protein Harman_28530 [Haloarcula mannanilytica]|uniref:Uncharacterized protein n=1 Tax=Haloarcula mannanilytica TaxID=2509225 RepID=A0A4C2EK87_9EURY|nr:hypothetical protein [Haloarcula mannanilytica]GCF14918.1 hypothetical protein Harman_28530 [Haloarcula mannanilytica]